MAWNLLLPGFLARIFDNFYRDAIAEFQSFSNEKERARLNPYDRQF
jgi:hypothetical protein